MKPKLILKTILITALCLLRSLSVVEAQGVAINTTGNAADNSAILDASSTGLGVLFPRMTTMQRDAIISPAMGLFIYNTDCSNFNYYDGTSWKALNTNNGYIPGTPGIITGSTNVCTNAVGVIYSIVAVPDAISYLWSVPSGSVITSGQGTTSITVTFGNTSGNISVSQSSACGTSSPSTLAVTSNSAPSTPGPISGFNTAVPGQTAFVTYSITSVPNATNYNWTLPSGVSILSGAGTSTVIVNYSCSAVSGNISVTAQNSCGSSTHSALSVTVSPIVTASAGGNVNTSVCPNVTPIGPASGTGGAGGYTFSWSPLSNLSNPNIDNPIPQQCTIDIYTVTVTDANGCTATSSMNFGTANPVTYDYTGTQQIWIVPAGVTSITTDVRGASASNGGNGARVQTSTQVVTPGETLYVYVGGSNGFNGGGSGSSAGCCGFFNGVNGGGGSDIRRSGNLLINRIVVAGGGGGTGSFVGGSGGENGINGAGDGEVGGGGGGTQVAGGTGGSGGNPGGGTLGGNGTNGVSGNGGNGGQSAGQGAGGGGGGYYGGGGGGGSGYYFHFTASGDGGGGSSYSSGSGIIYTTGYQSGNGQVIISY